MSKNAPEESTKLSTVKAMLNKTVVDVLPESVSNRIPEAMKVVPFWVAVPVVMVGSGVMIKVLRRIFGCRKESK